MSFHPHDIHAGSVLLGFVASMIWRKRSAVKLASGETLPKRPCVPMASAML